MKVKSNIPQAVLAAATGCLQPYCEQLNPANLCKALNDFQTENKSPDKLLSYVEVAKMLGVSRMTVCRMVSRKELPHLKVSKRTVRIPASAVEKFLNTES